MFFKVVPGVLGCLVKFSITSRFVLGRPVFPGYLSISYDYGLAYVENGFLVLRKEEKSLSKTAIFLTSARLLTN